MAPPVAVYIVVAVSTVAAVVAFEKFVYEPHIAPRVEKWAEDFLAKRRAKKMKRSGAASIPVPSTPGGRDDVGADSKSTYELESLVENEVAQWRTQVDLSRGEGTSTLRQRHTTGRASGPSTPLDESNIMIPYDTMTPTHILFDPMDGLSASSPTSTSTLSSRVPTPSPHSSLSATVFRTPPPPGAVQAPPTPEPSARGSPIPSTRRGSARASPSPAPPAAAAASRGPTPDPFSSPHDVPSLSLSHPVDLDAEHDLELLSAPSEAASSRPVSPFSEVSQTHSEQYQSFTLSPHVTTGTFSDAGSELEDDAERWSNADAESEVSGSSWTSAGARSH